MNGYAIKLGNGCGIKATMLLPDGSKAAQLKNSRYVQAVLILPSLETEKVVAAYDELTNALYVRLTSAELSTAGQYAIIFNVMLEDGTMYSCAKNEFAYVSSDASDGYQELAIDLSLIVLQFPNNVANTGASPKISANGTWLVYNDTIKAYEDTGIDCGSTAAEDAKAAAAAAKASQTAAESASSSATTAANSATTAVTNANTAVTNANKAKTECDTAAAAAQAVVDAEEDRNETIAQAVDGLDKIVTSVAERISAIASGNEIVENLKAKKIEATEDRYHLHGEGAPTTIPSLIGQHYADITNKKSYTAYGISAVSDWVLD
jgi:chemotaxis protein histidine kinase CheA